MAKIPRNDPCPCGSGDKYKQCHFFIDSRSIHDTLKLYFGEKWIIKQLGEVKTDGFDDLNPINLFLMGNVHPIISSIYSNQEKRNFYSQTEGPQIPLGPAEAHMTLLHKNLCILEPKLDLELTRKRLRDHDEYHKVEFEIIIASGYRRLGYQVNFIPTQPNVRTPEFFVEKQNTKVTIECKRKDMTSDESEKIQSWLKEFQHLLNKKLKRENLYFGVKVQLSGIPKRDDTTSLIDKIIQTLQSMTDGSLSEGVYKVFFSKFGEKDQEVKFEPIEKFSQDCDVGFSYCFQRGKEVMKQGAPVRNPRFIGLIYSPEDIDKKVDAVIANIKSANGQLSDETPNLVYVDLNISIGMEDKHLRETKIVERLIPEIQRKFQKDWSKISAVVVCNIQSSKRTEFAGFHVYEKVVLNPNAKKPLPEDFQIYGGEENYKIIKDLLKNCSPF